MSLRDSFMNGYKNIDLNNNVFATEKEEFAYLISCFGTKAKLNGIAKAAGIRIRESQTRYENTYRIAQKPDNKELTQRMQSADIFADKVAYTQTLRERSEIEKQ